MISRPKELDNLAGQLSFYIYLYEGNWETVSHHSRFNLIKDSVSVAIRGSGKIHSMELRDTEQTDDGRRRVIYVVARWWGDDDEESCICELQESLIDHLRPEYDGQVEVEIVDMHQGM